MVENNQHMRGMFIVRHFQSLIAGNFWCRSLHLIRILKELSLIILVHHVQ